MKSPALSALSLALAAALAAPTAGTAATLTWIGADGASWTSFASWQGVAFFPYPLAGDDVLLGTQPSGTFNVTANFNAAYGAVPLSSLLINATGIGGVFTLSQTAGNTVMNARYQTIGYNVFGNVYDQSAGSNSASSITLGSQSGGVGKYQVSGSAKVTTGVLQVGESGTGYVNQSGGTVTVGTYLDIGYANPGTSSSYILSGGTLALESNAQVFVGVTRGDFFHSGGTLSFEANTGLSVFNAKVAGVDSTYVLSGTGQIVNARYQSLGQGGGSGVATFTQTGGSNGFASQGVLYVGDKGNGAYNMSGGTLDAPTTYIGNLSGVTGTFSQTGGSFSRTFGMLIVGSQTGATGTYNLSGTGSLALDRQVISNDGDGTFNQSGGSNAVFSQLIIGNSRGAGVYNLSGGTLDSPFTYVGLLSQSTGTFSQTGGSFSNANGQLSVGANGNRRATYNLSGAGQLAMAIETIGSSGTGVFNQSGGSNAISDELILGSGNGNGSYILSGGTLTFGSAGAVGRLSLGRSGSGLLTQTGGEINPSGGGVFQVGVESGAAGTYVLKGGTLIAGESRVGVAGTGSVVQSGGSHTTGTLALGLDIGGSGSYVLNTDDSMATLISGNAVIGSGSSGTFRQLAGTHTVAGDLTLGAFGKYYLDGGDLAASSIKVQTSGLFEQKGGTANAAVTNDGTINFSGGTFAGSLVNVTGFFNQTGGTVSAMVTNSGTFNASGGSFAGALANNVGGYFTQRGGNVNGTLTNDGVFSVLGGSLDGTLVNRLGGLLDVQAGSSISALVTNDGTFSYQGGSFLGSMVNGVGGTVFLNGVLTAGGTVTNEGTIGVGVGSGLGGSMLTNNNSINMTGGQLTGADIVNNGSITGYGSFAGGSTLTNYGQIVQSGGNLVFNSSTTSVNLGSITLAGGRQLRLQAGVLDNYGSVVLNGALVSGAGTLQNSVGGTVSGGGVVTARLVNQGSLVPGAATLNVTRAWTNSGLVQLTGPTSVVTGAAITNTGTIQGLGMVGSTVANTGTIEAIGGTLTLGGALSNAAGGNLVAGSGGKLLAQGGLVTNAGLISLTGGTFDNGGKALNNTAQITGYGTLSTGGLTNAGTLTLATGVSTVNGALTNAAGGQVEVAYGNAIFSGAVVNNGDFKTTSANVVFAGGFTNNGSYVSDPSVQRFGDLRIGSTGTLVGGAGDVFKVGGSFLNGSTQAQAWNTGEATLVLLGGGNQDVSFAGMNLGANYDAYNANFSWGGLELGAGLNLNISSDASRALYTGLVVLTGGLSQLASINSAANIYYDGNAAGNAWLQAGTYAFGNGGGALVAVVPEPASGLLALLGLLAVGAAVRQRGHVGSLR